MAKPFYCDECAILFASPICPNCEGAGEVLEWIEYERTPPKK